VRRRRKELIMRRGVSAYNEEREKKSKGIFLDKQYFNLGEGPTLTTQN